MPAPRGGLVYHWRHGWIPRDHFAALQKAHGSKTGAAKIMDKHGISHEGHGSATLMKSDVHGDGHADLYKLPSGHQVSVERKTGRVLDPFRRDASGRDAIDANPHLLQKKSIGSSVAHDDHYVLAGHDKARVQAEDAAKARATAPGLSAENLRLAQLRGHMTGAQVKDQQQRDSARRAAARAEPAGAALAREREGRGEVSAPGTWTAHKMPDGSVQVRNKNGVVLGKARLVTAGKHAGQWEGRYEGRHGADHADSPQKVIDALFDSVNGPGAAATARAGGSPEERRLADYKAAVRAHMAKARK